MDPTKQIGLKVELGAAIARELEEPRGQLPLLPEPRVEPEPSRLGRGMGRPRGSRNRRAREVAEELIRRYGSPLEGATKIAATDVLAPGALEDLARTLGCAKFEAAEWWRRVLDTVLPYLHQRQPQAVEVEDVPRIVIVSRAGDDARDVTAAAETVPEDDVGDDACE
jgi:hypothetical protein